MILAIIVCALFLPLGLFWGLWCLFALLAALPVASPKKPQPSGGLLMDIVIPAHDEELLLPALLQSLQAQTDAGKSRIGTILVIADHCSDSTAAIARAHGATVLERSTGPRGKPAALRDGLAFLKNSDHALILLDADCTCSTNFAESMAAQLDAGHQVLQSAYILTSGDGTKPTSPSLLAFALKNVIRPRGMSRLGIPTQLFGTGMCFHPDVLRSGVLTFHDHLIEDLALSHQLLLRGTQPTFVPEAVVSSPMPTETSAMSVQKLRWESGQLQTWRQLPRVMIQLLSAFRLRSIAALLDWSAPPLSIALGAWLLLTAATIVLAACHIIPAITLLVPAITIALLVLYVLAGTLQLAGPSAILRLAFAIPRFLFWKATLYARMLTGHSPTSWQRTPRTNSEVHS